MECGTQVELGRREKERSVWDEGGMKAQEEREVNEMRGRMKCGEKQ